MECAVCGISGGTHLQHCAECEVNLCLACDSVVTTMCTLYLLLFPAREHGHLVMLTTAMCPPACCTCVQVHASSPFERHFRVSAETQVLSSQHESSTTLQTQTVPRGTAVSEIDDEKFFAMKEIHSVLCEMARIEVTAKPGGSRMAVSEHSTQPGAHDVEGTRHMEKVQEKLLAVCDRARAALRQAAESDSK